MKDKSDQNVSGERRGFLKSTFQWAAGTALFGTAANLFANTGTKTKENKNSPKTNSYIGQIKMYAGDTAPDGWLICDGRLLSISEFVTLFSILGNYYGGDGRTNFALPDFRRRVAISAGSRFGYHEFYFTGQTGGKEESTIDSNQLPSHWHGLAVNANPGNTDNPKGNYLAANSEGINTFSWNPDERYHGRGITETGSGKPFSVVQPYAVINYIICYDGVYPPRS
jgi:microcystin-dependent protein